MVLNRDYCAWTHAGGAGVSARPPPRKTKTFFFAGWGAFLLLFSMGRALCYVYLLMKVFYRIEAFLLFFLYVGGLFVTSSSWCEAFFTMWGPFLLFLFHVERLFLSLWWILCLYGFFYGLAPSPYDLFCGRMLLCNFHPMFSAITYSGHYVPNKAHCNTHVQFTITMK